MTALFTAASAPVTITPGKSASIPCPAHAAAQLPWVVVNNASPYTLIVSTGAVSGQLPAFTADVFPTLGGQPIGLAPVVGSQQVGPGQDSTVYATWSQERPTGSYPAAIGSGAATFVSNSFADGVVVTAAAGHQAVSPIWDCSGFQGARWTIQNNKSTCCVVQVYWATESGLGLGYRYMVIAPLGAASFASPHYGDTVQLFVTPQDPVLGQANVTVIAAHHQSDVSRWLEGLSPIPSFLNPNTLAIASNAQTIAAGATLSVSTALTYAGPGLWAISTEGTASYSARINSMDVAGNWQTIAHASTGDQAQQITVPAAPVQIALRNLDGVARAPFFSWTPDEY